MRPTRIAMVVLLGMVLASTVACNSKSISYYPPIPPSTSPTVTLTPTPLVTPTYTPTSTSTPSSTPTPAFTPALSFTLTPTPTPTEICIDNDNYCPWECNYWKLDNDCSAPQIYDFIASNDPSDYTGDVVHWSDTEWRSYQPLIDQVNDLIAGIDNDYDKAVKIAEWVAGSRPYGLPSPANEGKSVIEIYEADTGVCLDAAILTAAMFRIAGFPARAIEANNFWHEYCEVYIQDRWIGFDATFGGGAPVIDPVTTMSYTLVYFETRAEVRTHWTEVWGTNPLMNVVFYRSCIIPRTSLTSNWGFVYVPVTNRLIFEDSEDNYSLSYDNDNIEERVIGWEMYAVDLSCTAHNCEFIAGSGYNQKINPVDILGYPEGGGTTLYHIKNGFAKITLPEGRYRIDYMVPWIGNVSYMYFEIAANSNVVIYPNELVKYSEADDDLFNLVLEALDSSIEGLHP